MVNFKDFLIDNKTDAETYFNEKMNNCINLDILPKELVKCTCCDRHKIDFPTLGCKLSTSVNKDINTPECTCPCRHIARHLCREWDIVNEVEDINSSDEELSEDTDQDSYNSMDDFIVEDDEKEFKFTKKARKELRRAIELFKSKNIQK